MAETPNNESRHFFDPQARTEHVEVQKVPPYKTRPTGLPMVLKMLPHFSQTEQLELMMALFHLLETPPPGSAKHPYRKLRRRMASLTFYLAFWSLIMALTTSTTFTLLLITGGLHPSLISASGVVTSNALCAFCFKFHKDANDRLDSLHLAYNLKPPSMSAQQPRG